MTLVDVLLVVLVLGAAAAGWRQGFVAAACSLLGAVVLAVGAITLLPAIVRDLDSAVARTAVSLALLILAVLLGEFVGGWAGRVISDQITWSPARSVDRTLGMIGQAAVVLVLSWVVATPLASAPIPALASSIRNSAILGAVNRVAPDAATKVSEQLRSALNATGFPDILGPLGATPVVDVPAPDAALANDPAVATVAPSVLKIRNTGTSCGKSFTGTGFVIGPGYVMTNAHVVAGSGSVSVESNGQALPAAVVDYDPELDLAVLLVPNLQATPLAIDTNQLPAQADAIVLGYPLGGPFTVGPARVRSATDISGPNLYDSGRVTRSVYLLRADVKPGNSGGPLIDPTGTVVGVIFGASVEDPNTAFAMTAAQVLPTVKAGLTDTTPADTRTCVLD